MKILAKNVTDNDFCTQSLTILRDAISNINILEIMDDDEHCNWSNINNLLIHLLNFNINDEFDNDIELMRKRKFFRYIKYNITFDELYWNYDSTKLMITSTKLQNNLIVRFNNNRLWNENKYKDKIGVLNEIIEIFQLLKSNKEYFNRIDFAYLVTENIQVSPDKACNLIQMLLDINTAIDLMQSFSINTRQSYFFHINMNNSGSINKTFLISGNDYIKNQIKSILNNRNKIVVKKNGIYIIEVFLYRNKEN